MCYSAILPSRITENRSWNIRQSSVNSAVAMEITDFLGLSFRPHSFSNKKLTEGKLPRNRTGLILGPVQIQRN